MSVCQWLAKQARLEKESERVWSEGVYDFCRSPISLCFASQHEYHECCFHGSLVDPWPVCCKPNALYQAQAVCRHLYCHLLAVCNLWGLGFVWVLASASDVAMPDLQNICKWQVQFWNKDQYQIYQVFRWIFMEIWQFCSGDRPPWLVDKESALLIIGRPLEGGCKDQPLGVFDGFLCFFGQRPNASQLPFLRKAQTHARAERITSMLTSIVKIRARYFSLHVFFHCFYL